MAGLGRDLKQVMEKENSSKPQDKDPQPERERLGAKKERTKSKGTVMDVRELRGFLKGIDTSFVRDKDRF